MTIVAITVAAAVCAWSVLLVISDERQRALSSAQHNSPVAVDSPKSTGSGKRKN